MIRPTAELLVPTIKTQFRLNDDHDSDIWKHYILNGGKVTKYDDKLVFKKSVEIFTLRGDVLKKITDYKFITTDSPDAKQIIDTLDEMHSDIISRGKRLRDRNLL